MTTINVIIISIHICTVYDWFNFYIVRYYFFLFDKLWLIDGKFPISVEHVTCKMSFFSFSGKPVGPTQSSCAQESRFIFPLQLSFRSLSIDFHGVLAYCTSLLHSRLWSSTVEYNIGDSCIKFTFHPAISMKIVTKSFHKLLQISQLIQKFITNTTYSSNKERTVEILTFIYKYIYSNIYI